MSGTQSGATRIEDTVRDFWTTRPRRPRRGRKIAGVASGIANRYRIDPVLVRVGFVVAAIYGGAGVVAYLLGWLFLPEQDDQASPIESLFGKGRSSTSSGFTVLLCLIMVPVGGWFFSGAFTGEFSSWAGLLVVGGLLFLLHQRRGNVVPVNPSEQAAPATAQPTMPVYPPAPQAAPQPTMPFTPPSGPPVDTPAPYPWAHVPQEEPRTTPPAWDPLGAAPFAWDLPEPATPEPEEPEPPTKRRKPKVGTATLGIALVTVAGLALAANASWAPGGWITPQHAVGVVLAIVGLGLVAGAIVRSGRGLLALAVPLSVVGMGLTTISPDGYHGVGELNESPTSLTSVLPMYERSVGSINLDLTGLPASGSVVTNVRADVGSVEVRVPKNADVTITCSADAGTVDCLGRQRDGVDPQVDQFTDLGPDGVGGVEIDLIVSTDLGDVEVRRG
ncbi:PspC domain-containing protein [Actinophytocola sp.]|uniref:PspC domain-containing protein n=1 Tax=Actinophytocola sp. TaxID=1872138 RepID=UPI002D5C1600|nr:PspC domain-containing protein [Actinophytocola sp.]HYQ69187.1 PspC domain-containing protein [Actinophytocola sp.]